MPQFFIADVRKRANADFNLHPQAIPEARSFPEEDPRYLRLVEQFSKFSPDTPDEPVGCDLAGAPDVTMEWTADPISGQIDFYANGSAADEPERFLTLYFLSGANPETARKLLRPLEQYADFSQCLQYPLVLLVVDDPLPAAWQHAALESMREGLTPLAAAFLKVYFPAEISAT